MVEMTDERQDVAVETADDVGEVTPAGRRGLVNQGRHLVARRRFEHRPIAEGGDPLDEQVDDLVTHPAHCLGIELERIVGHALGCPPRSAVEREYGLVGWLSPSQCRMMTFRPTIATPRRLSMIATRSASHQLEWAARPTTMPQTNSWAMQTTSAAASTTSVEAPVTRASARTIAGGTAATSSGVSAIAIEPPWRMLIGPRMRWLMILDQAWASQKTTIEITRWSAMASADASCRHWTATMPVTSSDP